MALGNSVFLVWFYLASKFTCILCLMHLLVCLGIYQINLYLAFLYVYLYLIMYFRQFKWFLIKLLLAACILRYSLLLDVLIDIYFVFTMYLINLLTPIEDIVDTVFESNNDSYVLYI